MSVDVATVATKEGSVEALTELLAGDIGTAAKLKLFKSGFSPSPDSVEADFAAQEADFVGYTAATLTWGAVGLDSGGNAITYSDRVEFTATDATSPNTIGGAWLEAQTAAGPPAVIKSTRYCLFDPPVLMTTALATLGLVVALREPSGQTSVIADY